MAAQKRTYFGCLNAEVHLLIGQRTGGNFLEATCQHPQLLLSLIVQHCFHAAGKLERLVVLHNNFDGLTTIRTAMGVPATDADRVDETKEEVAVTVHSLGRTLRSPIAKFLWSLF